MNNQPDLYGSIIKKIDEYHAEVIRTREETIDNSKTIAAIVPTLEEIRLSLRDEKESRGALCLRHDERIKILENISNRLTAAYETLVKFGGGVIAVGGVVITMGFLIVKFWHKLILLLDKIFS